MLKISTGSKFYQNRQREIFAFYSLREEVEKPVEAVKKVIEVFA